MLATFIIGLREGLEAALIVSIVATFLRRHGHSLRPMWIGVGLGIALSALVGIAITVAERALSQTAQEAMEGIIGFIATAMVTTMVLWMAKHSRSMKHDLEHAASIALASGTSRALVVMAFLAIVKEGFETAVLLLATFQAAGNAVYAATGAILGLLVAVALGIGLYNGGLRLNLARFFRYTSIFLVLVAGGLLVTSLRKFHEAGWLNAGQARTIDLSWLAPVGSVRGTVVTGILGIPADPRLVEVLAYAAYVLPMMAFVLWPAHRRPGPQARGRLQLTAGVVCMATAAGLALYPASVSMGVPAPAPIQNPDGTAVGTVAVVGNHLVITKAGEASTAPLSSQGITQHAGLATTIFVATQKPVDAQIGARSLTLTDVTRLSGGRLPVGITAARNPGPFTAAWTSSGSARVWQIHDTILDARNDTNTVVTLSGGGLSHPRTITVADSSWSVTPQRQQQVARAVQTYEAQLIDVNFWTRLVPALLVLAGLVTVGFAARTKRLHRAPATQPESALIS
ncbi:iron uptake transporter permease EfeU [Branchiibius sp. NY16-3462-2]|uniref:iron uptake transporter permease EfeU n=1 Tax=Branchiibius sp. NY16-3462-2 TaxID=1807500 RepID=UPI0007940FF2|nr:iron uptake transporter permease EfeU [Branchiibius sp. NY16-3462-2]KYH43128.1 hypothetical protein AZH51_01380 [Branchiibius sp. NY16-3462-2]